MIVVVPAFPNLIVVPFIAAIVGSLEVALHFPVDCEVGYVIATSGSPANFSTLAGAVRLWRPLTNTEIVNGFDAPNLSAGPCTAVTVALPGFSAVNELPLIDAIAGSDDVKVQIPGEFDTGAANEICCGVPGIISTVRSRKPETVTTGSTAKIVTFKVTMIERYPPDGACFAEILVVPDLSAVTVKPFTDATDGSALVKVQAPFELDAGKISSTLDTLSIESVISLNVPTVGLGAVTDNFIVAVVVSQFSVGDWVALIETSPPSNKVTLFPETVAMLWSRDWKLQAPSEVLVGAVRVNEPAERATL